MAANKRYLELLEYMKELHEAKAAGYSGVEQPDTWSNFREAERWGASALEGCLIRLGDKYRRAQVIYRDPAAEVVGEPLPRTLLDLASYALIAVCLWEEQHDYTADQGQIVPQWQADEASQM